MGVVNKQRPNDWREKNKFRRRLVNERNTWFNWLNRIRLSLSAKKKRQQPFVQMPAYLQRRREKECEWDRERMVNELLTIRSRPPMFFYVCVGKYIQVYLCVRARICALVYAIVAHGSHERQKLILYKSFLYSFFDQQNRKRKYSLKFPQKIMIVPPFDAKRATKLRNDHKKCGWTQKQLRHLPYFRCDTLAFSSKTSVCYLEYTFYRASTVQSTVLSPMIMIVMDSRIWMEKKTTR